MKTRVVVAGYGNPLRGDDGAGWRVADAIARRWHDRIEVLTGQQPVPEWSIPLARADVAFIVDAGIQHRARLRLQRIEPAGDTPGGHALGIEHVLALASTLYGRAPTTYLLELPVHADGFSEQLSQPAAAAVARAIRLLNRRLARLP